MSQKTHIRRWGIVCAVFVAFLFAGILNLLGQDTYAETTCTMTVDQVERGMTCEEIWAQQNQQNTTTTTTQPTTTEPTESTTTTTTTTTTEPTTEPATEPAGLDPSVSSDSTTTTTTAVPTEDYCLQMQAGIMQGSGHSISEVVQCIREANGDGTEASTANTADAMAAGGEYENFMTEQSTCYGDNPEMGWFACPLADDLSNLITYLYEHLIEEWLIYPPQALEQTSNAGKVTFKVWSDIRNIANALFIVYLLLIIFSQISGWQIQQYGIKKALPRAVVMIIIVNLSYLVCQGAVDISNILGSGVGGIFKTLNQTVVLSAEGSSAVSGTGGLLALIVVLVGVIIAAFFFGPAFLLPILFALIGAGVTIFFTFIMLVVRQALMTGLVIISPIAIACAVLPGTEKLYKKWFGLFKGLIFTYPIAAFLVYGGSFAGRLVVKSMGEDNFVSGLIGIAVVVVPPCFLPKITTSSVAAIDGAILRMRQRVTGGAQNAVGNSRMADKMRRQTQKRKVERASGTHIRRDGTVVMRRHFRTKHMNDHLADAQGLGARIGDTYNYRDARFRRNTLDEQLISEANTRLDRQGSMTSEQLANMLGTTEDPAMDAAITRRLRQQGDNGRDALANRIGQLEATGGAQAETALTNIAGELNRGREQLKNEDMVMSDWARDVTTNGVAAAGRLSTRQLTNDQVNRTTGASFRTMDTRAVDNYLNQIRQNSGTHAAAHVQQSVRDLLSSSNASELSVEKRRMLEQFASENLSGPSTGSWLA